MSHRAVGGLEELRSNVSCCFLLLLFCIKWHCCVLLHWCTCFSIQAQHCHRCLCPKCDKISYIALQLHMMPWIAWQQQEHAVHIFCFVNVCSVCLVVFTRDCLLCMCRYSGTFRILQAVQPTCSLTSPGGEAPRAKPLPAARGLSHSSTHLHIPRKVSWTASFA